VTYVLDGGMQEPTWGMTANHAYWLSAIEIRDPAASDDLGTVDAFSHGFGLADPPANPEQATSGTSGSFTFTGQLRTWQDPRRVAATDVLDLTLSNVAAVTIDTRRAHLKCDAALHITTDGPVTIRLAGCDRTLTAH
jgi:hypothetical protein